MTCQLSSYCLSSKLVLRSAVTLVASQRILAGFGHCACDCEPGSPTRPRNTRGRGPGGQSRPWAPSHAPRTGRGEKARAGANSGRGSSAGAQGADAAQILIARLRDWWKGNILPRLQRASDHFPGPTQTHRKSRLSVPGRSSPRGPVSLVGSAPFRCIALLRPPRGGETSERPLWPTTAARLLRGALPTGAAATASR